MSLEHLLHSFPPIPLRNKTLIRQFITSVFHKCYLKKGSIKSILLYCCETYTRNAFPFILIAVGHGIVLQGTVSRFEPETYTLWQAGRQCSGSMTFWCGSGSVSADPCLWPMDPDADPDPAIFVITFKTPTKNEFKKKFFCLLLFEGTFTLFCNDKKFRKKSLNSRNQDFSYFFVDDRRIRIRIRIHTSDLWIRIRIREA